MKTIACILAAWFMYYVADKEAKGAANNLLVVIPFWISVFFFLAGAYRLFFR